MSPPKSPNGSKCARRRGFSSNKIRAQGAGSAALLQFNAGAFHEGLPLLCFGLDIAREASRIAAHGLDALRPDASLQLRILSDFHERCAEFLFDIGGQRPRALHPPPPRENEMWKAQFGPRGDRRRF